MSMTKMVCDNSEKLNLADIMSKMLRKSGKTSLILLLICLYYNTAFLLYTEFTLTESPEICFIFLQPSNLTDASNSTYIWLLGVLN